MMYPNVEKSRTSAVNYVVEIDKDSYPWPTLLLWEIDSSSRSWLEWGVFPAPDGLHCAQECTDGVLGSICFRFDANTGRLYGVEIPSNVVQQSLQIPRGGALMIDDDGPRDVFVDVDFWKDANRPREKAIEAPVRSYTSDDEIRIELMDAPLTWFPISKRIWVARNSEWQIAGIRCIDPLINFDRFAKAI
jgi:hypothetical protein